jgi:poly-gamma-glutamate synthesis protein (capsule biosynthesis protein)
MTGEEAAKPLIMNVAGLRIAIVNCAEAEACVSLDNGPGARGLQLPRIVRQIRRLQRENDFVLVIFHGGREYTPLPPEYVAESLKAFADAGASAVIAHHPHVPQGLEWHNGVPIIYSLGNFVFLQEDWSFYRHTGYLVHLDIRGKRLSRMEITPYLIQPQGLSMMQGTLKVGFLSVLHTVSQLLADPAHVRSAWDAFIDSIGLQGMQRMLRGPLAKLDTELPTGAAQLQNLFFTPAHRNLLIRGLQRAAAGQTGDSPDWAKALVDHWLHCRLDEGISRCQTMPTNNNFLPDSLHNRSPR